MAISDDKRMELAKSLKAAVTGDILPDASGKNNHFYSTATGTLYCNLNGAQIPENDIRNAALYFRNAVVSIKKLRTEDAAIKAHYCEMAAEALEQLINGKSDN